VRSVTFVLAVVLWSALVAGWAGAAEIAVVPRETYVRRADAVCLDVAQKALKLQREAQRLVADADSDADARRILGRVYRNQLGLVRGMRLRIVAIGTPRGAAAARVATRLVAGIRTGERALEDVIEAVETGALTSFERAVSRYKAVSLESARAVRRSGLGFRYCGAGA
jgi:hypothetical protein